jgi:argininosuccinate lyase
MPQKKNPDVLEVIRARMGHVIGNFTICALVLKALPSGYNLDFQEVTPKIWESFTKINKSLHMLSRLIIACKPKQNLKSTNLAFSASTELVRVLFQKYRVPFRTAHKIVGALVRQLAENGLNPIDVTPKMLKEVAEEVAGLSLIVSKNDLKASVDITSFIKKHNVQGGPSPVEVQRMLESRKKMLASMDMQIAEMEAKIVDADKNLSSLIEKSSSQQNQKV